MKSILLLSFLLSISAAAQSVWTLRNSPTSSFLERPAGKPSLYLVPTYETNTAGDRKRYLRSTNGVTWSSSYLPFIEIPLACENSRFVGFQSSPTPQVWYSDNGSSFTAVTNATGGNLSTFIPRGIAYGNGVWIITGANGSVLRSADNAVSWRFHPTQAESLGNIIFGGGKFLAVTSNPATLMSSDGITWTIGPQIPGISVCFAAGKFLTEAYSSPDAVTWSELPAAEVLPWGQFFIGGANGTALTWNSEPQPGFSYFDGGWHGPYASGVLSNIWDAALCGDLWIAVTTNARLLTSPTPALPPPTAPALNIGPALRLSWQSQTGRSYIIQRSTNQTTWTDHTGLMLGTGAVMEWLAPASASREFFRVQVR